MLPCSASKDLTGKRIGTIGIDATPFGSSQPGKIRALGRSTLYISAGMPEGTKQFAVELCGHLCCVAQEIGLFVTDILPSENKAENCMDYALEVIHKEQTLISIVLKEDLPQPKNRPPIWAKKGIILEVHLHRLGGLLRCHPKPGREPHFRYEQDTILEEAEERFLEMLRATEAAGRILDVRAQSGAFLKTPEAVEAIKDYLEQSLALDARQSSVA